MKGADNVKKSVVQTVMNQRFSDSEKLQTISRGFGANNVSKPLFGKNHTTKSAVSNTGLNFGLKKASQSASWLSFQAIVSQSSNGSKTTGFFNCLMNILIIRNTNMSFTMLPIFTKTDVS